MSLRPVTAGEESLVAWTALPLVLCANNGESETCYSGLRPVTAGEESLVAWTALPLVLCTNNGE